MESYWDPKQEVNVTIERKRDGKIVIGFLSHRSQIQTILFILYPDGTWEEV